MKAKSQHSGRTLTVLGDDGLYRLFAFDDYPNIIAYHPIAQWDNYFILWS